MSGRLSYHSGLAAEEIVVKHYEIQGHTVLERRWRGSVGEIDIITRKGTDLIFIEVKKSRDFSNAAERLSYKQYQRICTTASEFIATELEGQEPNMRLDLAMVDNMGRIKIIENIIFD